MKFKFRFDSLLRVRQHQEKMEKQKLAELFSEKNQRQQELEKINDRCQNDTETKDVETVGNNRQYYIQKHTLHKHKAHMQQIIASLEGKIEQQRQKLADANRETKMIERLKENDKQAFIDEMEHMEQLQQNEIAIQRHNSTHP